MKNGKTSGEWNVSLLPGLLLLCLLMAGCSHHHRVQATAPPPPPEIGQPYPPSSPGNRAQKHHEKVLSSQTGIASWYGSPYHNARGANGEIYDQDAMTAAHRTLPMGTVVRVTNVATGQSAVVTITDRGPFVPGRIVDLSRAAALKTGVWRPGTARVRVDVLRYPTTVSSDGRWCVQIGALRHERTAKKLRDRLRDRYPNANVIEFKGVTGYWVRIRPDGGSLQVARDIVQHTRLSEGEAYIVRLN